LKEFQEAAQLVMDMVDPVEGDATESAVSLERLREFSQKLAAYVTETTKPFVTSAFGMLQAWYSDLAF